MLSELATLEVLQPTPLKRISSRDSEQEHKRGQMRLHFIDQELHERLHDFEYQTTRGFRDTWLRAT